MYYNIRNKSDYDDKLAQADYAYEHSDWRTAFGYYSACLQYAEANGMSTDYLEMKVQDCREKM